MQLADFLAALAEKRAPRKGAGLKRRACCNRVHDTVSGCPMVPVDLLAYAGDGRPIMRFRPEGFEDVD